MAVQIDTRDPADRWRYTCPKGHRNWEPSSDGFHCRTCDERPWFDQAVFDDLRDERTGNLVPRRRIRLV
ncbi:hypothetical protein ACFQH6_00735 [Halobacteriaceae archaeon GCM10025711]